MMMSLRILLAGAAAVMAAAASGAVIDYSYGSAWQPAECLGHGRTGQYEVAIAIDGAEFGGAGVCSLAVPVPDSEHITGAKAWLASSLDNSGAELAAVSATVADGMLRCTFSPAVVIPPAGLYAGYTFTVGNADSDALSEPVITRSGGASGGLWIRSGTTWRNWTDISLSRQMVSAMTVGIEGDRFHTVDLSVASAGHDDDNNFLAGADILTLPLSVTSYGATPSQAYTLTASINGGAPLPCTPRAFSPAAEMLTYGHTATVYVDVANIGSHAGDNDISFTLSAVGDVPNASAASVTEAAFFIYDRSIARRPLLEDYTALWCNYCPKGFAAMEYMNEKYPDDFIGLSWHNTDRMSVTDQYPNAVPSYPYAWLDRADDVDPYYGSGSFIETDWQRARASFTPADLCADAHMTDDSTIAFTARWNFIKAMKNGCAVSFILAGNGLSDPSWRQANAYGGSDPADYIPQMEVFCTGGTRVDGLTFNDIVLMTKNDEVTMSQTELEKEYSVSGSFDLSEALSVYGQNLADKSQSFTVVAIITDNAGGKVLNAAKAHVDRSGSVAGVSAGAEVKSVEYFDFCGRRLSAPAGLHIERRTFSDGTVKARLSD